MILDASREMLKIIANSDHITHISHSLTTGTQRPKFGGRNKHSNLQTMIKKNWQLGNAGTLRRTMVMQKLESAQKLTGNQNVLNMYKQIPSLYNIKIQQVKKRRS